MFCIWINYQSARIGGFAIIGWMHVESNWKCSHIHVEIWYIPKFDPHNNTCKYTHVNIY